MKTMSCHNNGIKELLPLYAEEALDEAEARQVEVHLSSCPDCRSEFALLQALASEPVPDPGQAFWDAMPARVFRAAKEQQTKRKAFDLSWLRMPLRLPEWTWAAASLVVAFLVSWIIVISGVRIDTGDGTEYQDAVLRDPADIGATVSMTELSGSDLDTVNDWAGQELTRMVQEAQSMAPSTSLLNLPDDMYEELADMSTPEMDRLNGMLTEYDEEG
jgi:anti-sigma factor RsiW